jgi:hypothetical protein
MPLQKKGSKLVVFTEKRFNSLSEIFLLKRCVQTKKNRENKKRKSNERWLNNPGFVSSH